MTEVKIVSSDITKIVSSVIIATLDPYSDLWCSSTDIAIGKSSGRMFHDQIYDSLPLEVGKIIFCPKKSGHQHKGKFDGVLFVVDSLDKPVFRLMLDALEEANRLKLSVISLPTIRIDGESSEVVESKEEALEGLARAIIVMLASKPIYIKKINIVCKDENHKKFLEEILQDIST